MGRSTSAAFPPNGSHPTYLHVGGRVAIVSAELLELAFGAPRVEQAPTYQQKRTIAEIRSQAKIRITRGANSLLKGDTEGALVLYRSAAEFFRPFDEVEMAAVIDDIAESVYETTRRSLQPAFFIAASLLEMLLDLPHVKANKKRFAETSYRLGLIYRNEYQSQPEGADDTPLQKAIEHSKVAAESHHDTAFATVSAQIGYANCLMDRAKSARTAEDAQEAIAILKLTKPLAEKDPHAERLLPYVCNSLGGSLLALRLIDDTANGERLLDTAIEAFSDAVRASEKYFDAEVWGGSKYNLAGILIEKAQNRNLREGEASFLRVRAIAELQAAVETYPLTAFPFHYAEAQFTLGQVLGQHALSVDQSLAEYYMFRAVKAYLASEAVFDEDAYPERWAKIQLYTGGTICNHARLEGVGTAVEDYGEAIRRFEEALRVMQRINSSEVQKCIDAIARAKEERSLLQSAADDNP